MQPLETIQEASYRFADCLHHKPRILAALRALRLAAAAESHSSISLPLRGLTTPQASRPRYAPGAAFGCGRRKPLKLSTASRTATPQASRPRYLGRHRAAAGHQVYLYRFADYLHHKPRVLATLRALRLAAAAESHSSGFLPLCGAASPSSYEHCARP